MRIHPVRLQRENRLTAVFVLVLTALLINSVLFFRSARAVIDTRKNVTHTWQVKAVLAETLSALQDVETGTRGYFLTGKDEFLEPYTKAERLMNSKMDRLRREVQDNPFLVQKFPELEERVKQRIAMARENIAMRRSEGQNAVSIARLQSAKAQMDTLRETIATMVAETEQRLLLREREAEASERGVLLTFLVSMASTFIALGIAFYLINRLFAQRTKAALELQQVNALLEQRVVERTLNLKQTNAKLTEANEELEAFSYSVSHDLRAPLRHIMGFAELLQKKAEANLDEAGRRYLRTIIEATQNAGNLVDDLLTFSRMGRVEMREDIVSMDQLVEEIRLNLIPETAGREIEWKIAPLPTVLGDPALLRIVWQNLIGNAVKYTRPCSRATIEIGCESDGDENRFFVRDNGVGFDMTYAAKLFGVFQRLHTKEQFEGTGIGLANVRRIISRYGGRTWAEGEVGKGATLWFTMPVVAPQKET